MLDWDERWSVLLLDSGVWAINHLGEFSVCGTQGIANCEDDQEQAGKSGESHLFLCLVLKSAGGIGARLA
jgi:hypothetical protein